MSYHRSLGAGPGPTKTYLVDLPFPWGDNTKVVVPLQQVINDAIQAIPVQQLAVQLVDYAWPEAKHLAETDLPQIIDDVTSAKWGEAKYTINQAISDVNDIAKKATVHVYIAAGLTVLGIALILWRKK